MIRMLSKKILVRLLPRYEQEESRVNLILVDKAKHFEGWRRGKVEAVGAWVKSVSVGEVVLFRGDAGTSFGVDSLGSANDGTDLRVLETADILAVEEPEKVEAA